MSSALAIAFTQRLTGEEVLPAPWLSYQQQLAALLDKDPDTLPPNPGPPVPAIFRLNKNDAPMVNTCLTYRFAQGLVDRRFADGNFAVEYPIADVEIWEHTRGALLITDIEDLILRLVDTRHGAPVLPLQNGFAYECEPLTTLLEDYDKDLNAWFGLMRLKFTEARF